MVVGCQGILILLAERCTQEGGGESFDLGPTPIKLRVRRRND